MQLNEKVRELEERVVRMTQVLDIVRSLIPGHVYLIRQNSPKKNIFPPSLGIFRSCDGRRYDSLGFRIIGRERKMDYLGPIPCFRTISLDQLNAEDTIVDPVSITRVAFKDLPMYLTWECLAPKFHEILKKGKT